MNGVREEGCVDTQLNRLIEYQIDLIAESREGCNEIVAGGGMIG